MIVDVGLIRNIQIYAYSMTSMCCHLIRRDFHATEGLERALRIVEYHSFPSSFFKRKIQFFGYLRKYQCIK